MQKTGWEIAKQAANVANDKKAEDILVLNMEGISPVTDYFVIASAGNGILVKAIADNIEEQLAEAGVLPLHKEGYVEGRWVLLDYGDCVVHIFLDEERNFYNLEQLWADAPSETFMENAKNERK
ncbi:MAG TPA: ribosome silencing factor [Candidatus Avacidaminococcus intestinavium]|uniref:Ribosomal silencing factor RsfS n=1 Tax=Candidatus Avacidaminococcus intestinavium TaxID=2840684 RepID=A0A9D1MRF0_9FIRM|nr:ribosome silencing factor [Candidatus Avacidaminococcus intestinavium]